GDTPDALLRALRDGDRERVRVATAVEQPEVVVARAASRDLQGVTLHPRARVEWLVVGERRPRGDQFLRLLSHLPELRPLLQRRIPRQHHTADPLIMLAVTDPRDPAAASVTQLGEKVDLLDTLAELLLVRRHLVEQLGVRDDDQPPLLGRDPDRVDVPE